MKRSFPILNIKNIIQSIDHQTGPLELMLDELILFFNCLNDPYLQVFLRSSLISFILSNIQLIQLYQQQSINNKIIIK